VNVIATGRASRPRADAGSITSSRVTRLVANGVGALGAGLFAWSGLHYWRSTHSLIGAAFFAEQIWVVAAYLVRRRATTVSARTTDWLVAFAGTFAGVLFRPTGAHPHWGVVAGFDLQVSGLVICALSFAALGRSFGFAAADRGLRRRGPYGVVRHPLYASYFLLQGGYVLQSQSWRNVLVMAIACGCNVARALAEERVLRGGDDYADYCHQVHWRLAPGIW
jgi:protein-S-isoprenylcysteine O-methyltransferase Ste14